MENMIKERQIAVAFTFPGNQLFCQERSQKSCWWEGKTCLPKVWHFALQLLHAQHLGVKKICCLIYSKFRSCFLDLRIFILSWSHTFFNKSFSLKVFLSLISDLKKMEKNFIGWYIIFLFLKRGKRWHSLLMNCYKEGKIRLNLTLK